MITDTTEEYMCLKYADAGEKITEILKNELERRVGGRTEEEVISQVDEALSDYYQSFIADGAPFTGKDIRAMKKELRELRGKLVSGGKGKSNSVKVKSKRAVALKAFLEVDRCKGTSTQAKKLALDRISEEFSDGCSDNTVSGWLKEVIHFTDIKQAGRGRRAKK